MSERNRRRETAGSPSVGRIVRKYPAIELQAKNKIMLRPMLSGA